ncbi:MAG: YaiO family outer membrane beta-barrel protein, partial [Hyphomicrobium sp.]|nr:YaiO family outer membrane beta-barrel protein [Hyphomicrobium sp.]
VAIEPESSELRLGLARVLYWSEQREAALTELETVLRGDPANYDALLLRGDVMIAQGDRSGARAAYEQARDAKPGNDDRDIAVLLARTDAPLRSRIDSGYAYERFNSARGNESGSYVQSGTAVGDSLSAYLRWDRLDQFDSIDNQYVAGAYWNLAPRWLLFAEAGGAPDADFRPRVQAQTAVEWLRQGFVQPLLGFRYFGYAFGEVRTLTPGLRLPGLGIGDLELRYAFSRNTDESHTGVATARYSWTRGRFSPYLAIYDGEEALPPQPEARFTTYAAGCVVNLDRNWSARLDYAYENRPDFYIHHTAALGLTYRF